MKITMRKKESERTKAFTLELCQILDRVKKSDDQKSRQEKFIY
jgi:hypothetical protein